MSSFAVTAELLTVTEHPNADRLELAQVGGYRSVVPKGQFTTGDYAIYIPEAAIVPGWLLDELGLTGRLAGPGRDRVKAVRLRGELSQGIVCRPSTLEQVDLEQAHTDQLDFAERLGIVKWQPPVPVSMAGTVEAAPDLLRWVDIENVKRAPDVFTAGEPVVATEKVHGTCCLLTVTLPDRDGDDPAVHVTSKGFGVKQLALQHDRSNLYWRAVEAYDLVDAAVRIGRKLCAARVGLFGEVYGAGVQDLTYGHTPGRISYAAFDIAYDLGVGRVRWVDAVDLPALLDRVPAAPVLYTGGYDPDAIWAAAEGTETLSGAGVHIREGVVVRPATERYAPQLGGRAIVKFVSEAYLLRSDATEYE